MSLPGLHVLHRAAGLKPLCNRNEPLMRKYSQVLEFSKLCFILCMSPPIFLLPFHVEARAKLVTTGHTQVKSLIRTMCCGYCVCIFHVSPCGNQFKQWPTHVHKLAAHWHVMKKHTRQLFHSSASGAEKSEITRPRPLSYLTLFWIYVEESCAVSDVASISVFHEKCDQILPVKA